jgi:hypothetical protein
VDIGIMGTLPPSPKITLRDTSIVGSSVQITPVVTGAGTTFNSFKWTQLSGPATAVISSSTTANTTISNLSNGVFAFRLTGTTANGLTLASDIVVKVFPDNNGKKTLRVNFSDTKAPEIPGWLNAYGPVTANFVSYTDPVTGWVVDNGSALNAYWSPVGNSNSTDNSGYNTGNNTGIIPDIALQSNWFNYSIPYAPGNENVILSRLNPAKTYTLKLYASRSSAGGATPPRYAAWHVNGGSEILQNAFENYTAETVLYNVTPDATGKIKIGVYRPTDSATYGSFSYITALVLQEN